MTSSWALTMAFHGGTPRDLPFALRAHGTDPASAPARETQGIGSPPGTWSQTSGNGYGVCQVNS
eukprot:1899128-Rhodomonas_salina.2